MHQLCNKVGSMRLGDCSEGANNLYVRAQLLNEVQRIFRPATLTQSEALKGSIGEFSLDVWWACFRTPTGAP